MSVKDLVEEMLVQLSDNIENIEAYLADDLTFGTGVVTAGKSEFLKMLHVAAHTHPPIEWFLVSLTQESGKVKVILEPGSEALGTMLKPGMEWPSMAEIGKGSELSTWVFAANNGKIASIAISAAPGSLLAGVLQQLGLV